MYSIIIFFIGVVASSKAWGVSRLFPDTKREYVYFLRTNLSTLMDNQPSTLWQLQANLHVNAYDNFTRARLRLDNVESSTINSDDVQDTVVIPKVMEIPWELEFRNVLIKQMYVGQEPEWSLNIKRAISINFQLIISTRMYSAMEPCLEDHCLMIYVGNGDRIMKFTSPDILVSSRHSNKRSEKINGKSRVSSTMKIYDMDKEMGLRRMSSEGKLQYKIDDRILAVQTEMSLDLTSQESGKSSKVIEEMQPLEKTDLNYVTSNHTKENHKDIIYNLIQKLRKMKKNESLDGLKIDNSLFMDIMLSISQLDFESITKLFNVISRNNEMLKLRNIFLQLLLQSKNDALPGFIKYMLSNKKPSIEQPVILSTITELPFKMAPTSQKILEDFEFLMNLDSPKTVRHAGILSFATIAQRTMEISNVELSYFDKIVEKYFQMYTDSLDYSERLIWLQGLLNLGYTASSYTKNIFINTTKDKNDRIWAGLNRNESMATSDMIAETALLILINDTEPIQLRILAIHLILSSVTDKRAIFIFAHSYILNCENDQLKHFWFSSIRSLEKHKNFVGYWNVSHLLPFVTNQISNPDPAFWSTGNQILTATEDGTSSIQMFTVGSSEGNLPEFFAFRLFAGGEKSFRAEIYFLLEGIPDHVLEKIRNFKKDFLIFKEQLIHLFKTEAVTELNTRKIHVDIVVKVQGNTIFATHINHTALESGSLDVLNHIEKIVGENYLDQNVYNYYQNDDCTVSDIGSSICLHKNALTITTLKRMFTNDDIDWMNHFHIRYNTATWTSLSASSPINFKDLDTQYRNVSKRDVDLKFTLSLYNLTLSKA